MLLTVGIVWKGCVGVADSRGVGVFVGGVRLRVCL